MVTQKINGNSDTLRLPKIVDTNSEKYLPPEALKNWRLVNIFDINGNHITDGDEVKGMEIVVESGGKEQWNIKDKDGRWVGYVLDTSEIDANPSDRYVYVGLNENEQRTYLQEVNIFTGDEVVIKYHYTEKGAFEERYHNRLIEGGIIAEYTGPNNDLPKTITETKAVYEQSNEFLKDENGEVVLDEKTGEARRKEKLVGYFVETIEYEYDENFKQIGPPKVTHEFIPVKDKKRLNIKG